MFLLLRLFVDGLGAAPLAILFEFDLALHQLFVLGGPVVNALALGALQFYESVLGHMVLRNPPAGGAESIY